MSAPFFERIFGIAPAARAYAPGRIEFLGNHLDYNGGIVLGAALDRGVEVAIGARDDDECHFVSETMGQATGSLDRLEPFTGAVAWANYPFGVLAMLRDTCESIRGGVNLAVTSTLPMGAGLGSSAALELATAYAAAELFGLAMERSKMVRLCRKAENEFVGMPCGILDQGVSAFGAPDRLVQIDCLTETFTQIPMPPDCCLWIFNTNKKHALIDSKYAERHRQCAEAFLILRRSETRADCLAQLSPETIHARRRELGEVLFRRVLHVSDENRRVQKAIGALQANDLRAVGALLLASHESSRSLFENSCAELDFLVEKLANSGGVHGARLSGGGFGGAVMALTSPAFGDQNEAAQISSSYANEFGHMPSVLTTRAGAGNRA